MATPRHLRCQNATLIDKLKAKQQQLKDSFNMIRGRKSKTPGSKGDRAKTKTQKLAQGKENIHPFDLRNNTSTPVIEVERKTPKSILKKRKIIDDNIKVTVPNRRSPLLAMNGVRNNINTNNRLTVPSSTVLCSTPTSTLDYSLSVTPDLNETGDDFMGPTPSKVKKNVSFNLDEGHGDVPNRKLATPNNQQAPASKRNRSNKRGFIRINRRRSPRRLPLNMRRPNADALKYDEIEQGKVRPLLGYDWIAGNLDSDPVIAGLSDAYLEEMKQFRRLNKEDCVALEQSVQSMDISRTPSPVIRDPDHTCIHTYALNSRLFTVPLNSNSSGESLCPICAATRRKPTSYSPGFVRVSIPKGVLRGEYQRKPHRRKSFDPSDSYALTEHCLAGWENARPAQMPTATVVDLRQASGRQKSKQPTTLEEAEEMAHSSKMKLQGRYQANVRRSLRHITNQRLLNTSNALRSNLHSLCQ